MSRFQNFLKIALLVIISIIIILFSVSLLMHDKVADTVIKTLNSNLETKITTGSFRFSLLRQFPNASVELKNVIVHSSPGFIASDFPGISTDTLLSAKSASVEIGLINLIRKNYSIARITLRSGKLNLFTDSTGMNNFTVITKKDKESYDPMSVDLRRINLSNIWFVYSDQKYDLTISGKIDNARLKGNIAAKSLLLTADSKITFNQFRLRNYMVRNHVPSELDIEMHRNEYGFHFRKSRLSMDDWEVLMTGSIFKGNDLDLSVVGNNINIARISNYLPDKYKTRVSEYHPSGILKLESSIKGFSTASRNPHVEVTFSVDNARVSHTISKTSIENLSFSGSFTNGQENKASTSNIEIRNFSASMGSGKYKGYFKINDFRNPSAELTFNGTVNAAEMSDFLNLPQVKSVKGNVDIDIRLLGNMPKKSGFKFSDILSLNQNSRISFRSLGFSLIDRGLDFNNINGNFFVTNITTVDNLTFNVNNLPITFSGQFQNLPLWLAGNESVLYGSGKISAHSMEPERLINKKPVENTGRKSQVFPNGLNLDIDFSFDTLNYKKFTASDINGKLNYIPSVFNFKSLSFKSQDGIISGNGLLLKNFDKSLIAKGSFTLDNVNINKAFSTFNNFSQNFIKAENLAGSLSGSVSVLLPLDSLFRSNIKGLVAEGKYLIKRGALIDFEPVKKLSAFIQLSELQNISFDEFENDFFIRNNALYMPQMQVRSSAADLSVNGKHDFNNTYEYHVKMLLSEILSKKARKNKTLRSEFGEVEDDGLGRTSVFLKIEGKGKESKVTYDLKAAGSQIKSDIKRERENLGKILDEEYRHKSTYPSDSKAASKPRFRIKWEGSDTTNINMEPEDVNKERIRKNLFKKKL